MRQAQVMERVPAVHTYAKSADVRARLLARPQAEELLAKLPARVSRPDRMAKTIIERSGQHWSFIDCVRQ